MTVQEIINEVKARFDQPGSVGTFSDTQFLSIINDGYIDFCRYTEVKDKQVSFAASAYAGLQSLPSDFIESRQIRWGSNTQLYPKSERDLDYIQSGWPVEIGSLPQFCIYYNYNRIRLKPIPNAAGTITMRYSYIPPVLGLTDTPVFQKMYHDALVSYTKSICFWIVKEKDNAAKAYKEYYDTREKAREQARSGQRTPDIMTSSRNVNVFNYPLWDSGYRIR